MTLTRITMPALTAFLILALAAPAAAQTAEDPEQPASQQQQQRDPEIPVVLVTDDDRVLETESVAVQTRGGRSWYFGVRGGAYFDVDEAFVGAELLFPMTNDFWFNPNAEWVFVDGADLATVNIDAHFDLPTSGSYSFWIGAGLGLRYFNLDGPREGDWDPGVNVLAGLGFGHGPVIPYVQGKLFINDDDTEFVLAGGFRF